MVASASKPCTAKVPIFFALLFGLANCRSFENIVHDRGLKTIDNCGSYQTGTDWPGNDINQTPFFNIANAPACCTECNNRYGSRVVAYIYRTDHQHCYCKNAVSAPTHCPNCQGSNVTATDNPDTPDPDTPAPDTPTCTTEQGMDSFGNDLPGSPIEGVNNSDECCSRCHNYGTGCMAWTYRSDDRRCYLKSRRVDLTSCQPCTFGEPVRP